MVEGLGCKAIRVHRQEEIAPAIAQAEAWMAEYQVPVVIEVMLERVTNIAMGTEIDNDQRDSRRQALARADAPTAIGLLDERRVGSAAVVHGRRRASESAVDANIALRSRASTRSSATRRSRRPAERAPDDADRAGLGQLQSDAPGSPLHDIP